MRKTSLRDSSSPIVSATVADVGMDVNVAAAVNAAATICSNNREFSEWNIPILLFKAKPDHLVVIVTYSNFIVLNLKAI